MLGLTKARSALRGASPIDPSRGHATQRTDAALQHAPSERNFLGAWAARRNHIDFKRLVEGKLVVTVLPRGDTMIDKLRECAAKDILVLGATGTSLPTRHSTHAQARLQKLSAIAQNNGQVAILESFASLAIWRKRNFWRSRLDLILVPADITLVLTWLPILFFQLRRRLAITGTTTLDISGKRKHYLVLELPRKSSHNRRLFVPADLSTKEKFRYFSGIDYVLLRSIEAVEADDDYNDLDVLVSDNDLPRLRARLQEEIGTYPIEVYTETGVAGHDFNGAPYFMPSMARAMLASAVVRESGIRAPAPKWRYLSLCYHLIFHGKSRHVSAGSRAIDSATFKKPRHYCELVRRAREAQVAVPHTFDDLDRALFENGAFPSKDLLGFYARRNSFVAERYVKSNRSKPGLSVFFVRDFGGGATTIAGVAEKLASHFKIVAEGPVNAGNRQAILTRVRGGNWLDDTRSRIAEPIFWFVCWDTRTVRPRRQLRRKYPSLDNARTARVKLQIRKEESNALGARILHASDNTDEALEHIAAIGLTADGVLLNIMANLER